MQIVYKDLSWLKPYKNNPRKNEEAVEPVANSIKEFGFKVPIVATSDGEIILGWNWILNLYIERLNAGKKRLEKLPNLLNKRG